MIDDLQFLSENPEIAAKFLKFSASEPARHQNVQALLDSCGSVLRWPSANWLPLLPFLANKNADQLRAQWVLQDETALVENHPGLFLLPLEWKHLMQVDASIQSWESLMARVPFSLIQNPNTDEWFREYLTTQKITSYKDYRPFFYTFCKWSNSRPPESTINLVLLPRTTDIRHDAQKITAYFDTFPDWLLQAPSELIKTQHYLLHRIGHYFPHLKLQYNLLSAEQAHSAAVAVSSRTYANPQLVADLVKISKRLTTSISKCLQKKYTMHEIVALTAP